MIRVVSVRTFTGPSVYVGRRTPGRTGHPLANPFKVGSRATEEERRECLEKYSAWLEAHPRRGALLSHLAEVVRETGLPLACFCGYWPDNPGLLCHAVALAKLIAPLVESHATPH